MNTIVRPLSEAIDMSCKGYLPVKMMIAFQEDVYDFRKISKDKRSLIFSNEDDTSYLQFLLNKEGTLEYVEYHDYDSDNIEEHILFNIKWTPELIKHTYNKYGVL